MKSFYNLFGMAVLAVFLFVGCGTEEVVGEPVVGEPFELSFKNAIDDELYVMPDKGVVLLDFWASFDPTCQDHISKMVNLNILQAILPDLYVVGISLDKDKDAMMECIAETGMYWPQYFDGQGWGNKISRHCGVRAIPRIYIVKDGILVEKEGRSKNLSKYIGKLLSE